MTGWFPPTFLFDLNRVYLNNVVLQGARHVGFQIFFLAAGLERRQGLGVPALIKFDEFSVRKHNAKTAVGDRKSTRLNSSHANISYAVFCLKKKNNQAAYSAITERVIK